MLPVHKWLRIGISIGAALAADSALAHVSYVDITSGSGVSVFNSYGWYLGTTPTLGDSHDLAGGDYFSFHVSQPSNVSITFTDINGAGELNPAFSLYSGLFFNEAHDDTSRDPLNPRSHTPPFPKIASPIDNGTTADAFGRISPFRDTANINYVGQFDALHSWSMANESDEWSVVNYLGHAAPTGGNSVSLLNFHLLAGDYTIAAGGGSNPANGTFDNLAGRITVTSTPAPVPVPAAAWMFVGALASLVGVHRRKCVVPF